MSSFLFFQILLLCPWILWDEEKMKILNSSSLLLAGFLLFIACGKSGELPVPPPSPPPQIQVDGKALFEKNCVACHGVSGKGDGPAAAALPNKPANLLSDKVQKKSDDELAAVIKNGTDKGMPPWKNALKEEEIKAVVKYVGELKNKK